MGVLVTDLGNIVGNWRSSVADSIDKETCLKLVFGPLHTPPSVDSTTLRFHSIGWIFIDGWPCFWSCDRLAVVGVLFQACFFPLWWRTDFFLLDDSTANWCAPQIAFGWATNQFYSMLCCKVTDCRLYFLQVWWIVFVVSSCHWMLHRIIGSSASESQNK